MKILAVSLLTISLCAPSLSFAGPGPVPGRPGAPGGAPGGNPIGKFLGDHGGPVPGQRFSVLPDLATALVIGGLTYWVYNGIYYQKQGDNYVVVNTPSAAAPSGMQVLDFGGKRYYLQDGHYYVRDINGSYSEVPRPAGL
nr:DUF6515 family protein [Klebsiella aerogenes]